MGNCKLSFENTKRLIDRNIEISDRLRKIVSEGIRESEEALRKEVNKQLYDLAEKQGISLWSLCFNVVPKTKIKTPEIGEGSYSISYEVTLEPLEFEFEKGPGYWKGKYYALKDKMRKLIDSKDDEDQDR